MSLCTGIFAATAITSAPTLSALVPIAVEMVLVAFRAGLYISKIADILENRADEPESWTYLVPETDEAKAREILEDFHTSNVLHGPSDLPSSSSTNMRIGIFGPTSYASIHKWSHFDGHFHKWATFHSETSSTGGEV